jgi:hypothetical protein
MRFLKGFKAVVFGYRVKNGGSWVKITLTLGVDEPF